MFEPRKLIPCSIEYCSAPIAVITEMTEKTPIVIPIIVRLDRSLFTPSELSAILMISLNNMSIKERGNAQRRTSNAQWQKCKQRPSSAFEIGCSATCVRRCAFCHSYRSAVTGSKRDAVQAGANPEMSPVITDTITLAKTSPTEN